MPDPQRTRRAPGGHRAASVLAMRRNALSLAFAFAALGFAATTAQSQQAELRHHEGLGSLSFPTSGALAAQADFERGVLLMHSFQYDDAAAAFREAQEADPEYAMAYWGEAMTHNHPIWDEQDRDAALEALARYAPTPEERLARAPTPRERMYLEAVEILYGAGPKATRDTLYHRAMEALVEAYPDDYEARAFRALAILGLSRGERDVPAYMRAGALALRLFEENPDHPGAAHYVIHAFDDPTHAPLGFAAAEAYADVAPDAAHAQHMTTHIFLALGMWEGVVSANERADAVVDRGRRARSAPQTDCGHYNEWLAYGYDQQGRHEDARALVLGCLDEAGREPGRSASATGMRALHLASTGDFAGTVASRRLDPEAAPPGSHGTVALVQAWADGFAAAGRGDASEARAHLAAFDEGVRSGAEVIYYWAGYVPVWGGTLRSVVARADGDLDAALAAAREAAEHESALPVDFGPPVSWKPPRELEGELLLEAGRPAEALVAFQTQLGRTPRRARTLEGFARAAEAAGAGELAAGARAELEKVVARRDR